MVTTLPGQRIYHPPVSWQHPLCEVCICNLGVRDCEWCVGVGGWFWTGVKRGGVEY